MRIEQISDRRQPGTVAASAYVLAGLLLLLLEEALVQQILGQDIVQDSVTYQAIKQEGYWNDMTAFFAIAQKSQ